MNKSTVRFLRRDSSGHFTLEEAFLPFRSWARGKRRHSAATGRRRRRSFNDLMNGHKKKLFALSY